MRSKEGAAANWICTVYVMVTLDARENNGANYYLEKGNGNGAIGLQNFYGAIIRISPISSV